MKIAILTIMTSLLLACGSQQNENHNKEISKITNKTSYRIIKDSSVLNYKRSVEIVLDEKVYTSELKKMAKKIKAQDSSKYERTFIGYYIKEVKNHGYWASTHYNPDLKVEILGLTKSEEEFLRRKTSLPKNQKIIGKWFYDAPYVGGIMVIYRSSKGELFLKSYHPDGTREEKLKESLTSKGVKFEEYNNGHGEYFMINKSKELEFWGRNGRFDLAEPLD